MNKLYAYNVLCVDVAGYVLAKNKKNSLVMSQESIKVSLTTSQAADLVLSEYVHVITIIIKCVNFGGSKTLVSLCSICCEYIICTLL